MTEPREYAASIRGQQTLGRPELTPGRNQLSRRKPLETRTARATRIGYRRQIAPDIPVSLQQRLIGNRNRGRRVRRPVDRHRSRVIELAQTFSQQRLVGKFRITESTHRQAFQ